MARVSITLFNPYHEGDPFSATLARPTFAVRIALEKVALDQDARDQELEGRYPRIAEYLAAGTTERAVLLKKDRAGYASELAAWNLHRGYNELLYLREFLVVTVEKVNSPGSLDLLGESIPWPADWDKEREEPSPRLFWLSQDLEALREAVRSFRGKLGTG